jgi:hypothetical protein
MAQEEKMEKVVREYKGDVTTVAAMEGAAGVACEVPVVDVPADNSQWGRRAAAKLPKLIIVTGIAASPYPNSKYLTYVTHTTGYRAGGAYVPNDFQLKKLTGRQGREMTDKYQEYQLNTNLNGSLQHSWPCGADPEIFVEDEHGAVIPAFAFLGSKAEPHRSHEGCGVYWDGFQAEFETRSNMCLAYLVDSVHYGLKAVYEKARQYNPNAKLSTRTVMEIPFDMLQNSEEKFVTFGCMPSLNVYGLTGKVVPARELPFRSSGGHIHFGFGQKPQETINEIVKALDAILGVACVSMFANFDNPIRREFYGLPGEYRLPAHGMEYRPLSNAWMFHPTIMNMVFDLSRKVVMFGQNGFRRHWQASEEETIDIVKHCDVARDRKSVV